MRIELGIPEKVYFVPTTSLRSRLTHYHGPYATTRAANCQRTRLVRKEARCQEGPANYEIGDVLAFNLVPSEVEG